MLTLWQDLRYVIRMVRKRPGFTAATGLTPAAGVLPCELVP